MPQSLAALVAANQGYLVDVPHDIFVTSRITSGYRAFIETTNGFVGSTIVTAMITTTIQVARAEADVADAQEHVASDERLVSE